jgi:hypothetical protein
MKKRGVPSPNRADALALTFTDTVAPKNREANDEEHGRSKVRVEYNPIERAEIVDRPNQARTEYDPYERS